MLHAKVHHHIVATDIDDDKLQAALEAGARAVFDSRIPDAREALLGSAEGPFAAALDFLNSPVTARLGLECLAENGKLALVGVGNGEIPLSLPSMVFSGKTVRGTNSGTLQELRGVVELANCGELNPVPITLMDKSLTNEPMSMLHDGKVVGRWFWSNSTNS